MSAPPPTAAPPVNDRVLPALDTLRAIAAVGVLASHVGFWTGVGLTTTWGGLFARGEPWVAVFFVLSGFLLSRPYAESVARGARRPATGRFYWRRALRILPAYWLLVVVCLTALPEVAATRSDWIRYLTLTQI